MDAGDPMSGPNALERSAPGKIIDRVLSLFTDIRPEETTTALLLTFNIFCLLSGYYILKAVREGMILSKFPAELTSYIQAAQAFLLIFVAKIFSRMASRVPRNILIARVTLFFISNLVIFYVIHIAGLAGKGMGIVFFAWVGIFNVTIIAQFWAFANDIYRLEAGKRLFPLIAFGATFGGFFGSQLTDWLKASRSVYEMMLVAAAILGFCIALTFIIHRREVRAPARAAAVSNAQGPEKAEAEKPVEPGGAFRLIWKNRYLLAIAVFVLLLNFINANGEYILRKVVQKAAAAAGGGSSAASITNIYAQFNMIMNLWAMFVQLFIVSRVFKWFGVRVAMFFLPVIALGGYAAISLGASFGLVKWVKALENGSDYSIMNTSRHALFLITTRREKYKAKAAIDTFFHRSGDAFAALLVFLGTVPLAFRVETFALINVAAVAVWIAIGAVIFRLHKKMERRGISEA
jgi:AAA family ATP:ADP antiporter